jgi:colicin import membrane protein
MIQETAPEPGKKQALALSIGMHLLLALALFLGVQWKTEHAAVEVELWSDIPRPATAPPPPVRSSEPTPKTRAAPERRSVKKADIVVKDDKKPKDKKSTPQRETPKENSEKNTRARTDPIPELQNQLAKEDQQRRALAQELERARREQELRLLADAEQRAAGQKTSAANWAGKIRDKVRGNIVLPRNVLGNPEALLKVTLLPTGDVIQVSFLRSSGNPTLDEAIERAFRKSSPLPKPDDPAVFNRNLEITYRPYE